VYIIPYQEYNTFLIHSYTLYYHTAKLRSLYALCVTQLW